MDLLVARAGGPKRELVDPVAGEARMRVAVDEAGDDAAAPRVEFDDVAVERPEITHPSDGDDLPVLAENERVPDDVDAAEGGAPERRAHPGRRCDLRDVADEEPRHCQGRPRSGSGASFTSNCG